ncbi:non-muscle cofilin 1-like [Hippoglossus hippoglossus]|uniref:non-muscle cofilin 1-like n=1 Tax=Hippoglossus hippoglossus TaxID=8267 RepID=UPI00148CDE23|nr:non-muscle cofilin 1-like [Hippoglossus hippoglossus]
MASGVKCSDEVMVLYNEMRLVKNDSNQQERIRLVVFEVKGSFIEPTTVLRQKDLNDEENVYKVFLAQMPKDKCRYLLYDCHYTTQDSPKEELVLVMWTPDTSTCKDKMIYASSKQYIKHAIGGAKHTMEFNDNSDYEISAFAKELGKDISKIEGHAFASKN